MRILSHLLLLQIAVIVSGCGLVKVPGISKLTDQEAQKKLYMAENYIELGAFGRAERELASFPKNSKFRPEVDALLSTLNEYRVPPDEEDPYGY